MARFASLWLVLLAGCPAPQRYVVTEVISWRAPVDDALVAARCGQPYGPAALTDRTGRARLALRGDVAPGRCVLTVAKPGYSTIEVDGVNACSSTSGCPPTRVLLGASYATPAWRAP